MTKILATLLIIPSIAFSCPDLEGIYTHCRSEIKEMKGEYNIQQDTKSGIEVYSVKYFNEEGNLQQEDEFKTDGSPISRKQTIPSIGVTVKVESTAICKGDTVISKGKAYLLGAPVGSYDSTIYKTADKVLMMKITAEYLGKTVNKLIQCRD